MIFAEHIRDRVLDQEPVPDQLTLENQLVIKPFEVEERPLPERVQTILETHPGFVRLKNGVSLTVAYGYTEKLNKEEQNEWTNVGDFVRSQTSEAPQGTGTEFHMTLSLGIRGYFAWTYIDNLVTIDESGIARVDSSQSHYRRTDQEDFRKKHFVDLRRGLVDQKNPRKGYAEDVAAAKALGEMVLPRREDFATEDEFAEDLILALCL